MVSVASLLNPVSSEPRISRLPPSPCSSHCTTSTSYDSPRVPPRPLLKKHKMAKDSAVFAKGKIKGQVNFPPFEDLDEDALREVQKYQVYPMGKIRDYCRHIPYNSEKKSFLEKTGRESFEVFQYIFKVPGDDKDYTVMWDYNIGLVRVTPFFKCCKYSKTTPGKMLTLNTGLKDLTHSITGGALVAQGYWMPYSCAFAVCATFCVGIAGALIPLFGPSFPSHCTPKHSPVYGRMVIDSSIITAATDEAHAFREQYTSGSENASTSYPTPRTAKFDSASPRELPREMDHLQDRSSPHPSKRPRLKRKFTNDSTLTDTDTSERSVGSNDRYIYSPRTPTSAQLMHGGSGWNAHNVRYITSTPISPLVDRFQRTRLGHKSSVSVGASPWLSAIPRSSTETRAGSMRRFGPSLKRAAEGDRVDEVYDREEVVQGVQSGSLRHSGANPKRAAKVDHTDEEYDGEESASGSEISKENKDTGNEKPDSALGGLEKKAAWLLMKLSVRDGECASVNIDHSKETPVDGELEAPRVKRMRATSW